MNNTLGVLLAGGESRRFGRPKAFANYKGKSFWEYSFKVLQNTTDKQIIISHSDLVDEFKLKTNQIVIKDDESVKGKGPLAGIYTAMKTEEAEWYVFLSCDIPLITSDVVKKLLQFRNTDTKIIVPKIEGKLHPLIGVYHRSLFSTVNNNLIHNKLKLISLFEQTMVHYITEHDMKVDVRKFSNINSPKDYDEVLKSDKISESE